MKKQHPANPVKKSATPRQPKYIPFNLESIPLPLVIRCKNNPTRSRKVITAAYVEFVDANGMRANYENLLADFTKDDGSPCGILVRHPIVR